MKWLVLAFACSLAQQGELFAGKKKYRPLTARIEAIIDQYPELHIGCEIYSLKNNEPIVAHNAEQLFLPASNMKLFLAATAFAKLGATYCYATKLLTDGVVVDGRIEGNLYFQASGDPSLTNADVARLFASLAHHGITEITGNLFLDLGIFDAQFFAPGSLLDNLGTAWNNPVSSCMIDRKAVIMHAARTSSCMLNKQLTSQFIDATTYFKKMLKKYGIALRKKIISKQSPQQHTVICTHYSEGLAILLSDVLKESDNLYADSIFKTMGMQQYQRPGSWNTGAKVVATLLKRFGIDQDTYKINDGSGRSRYNLVSPHQIVSLLRWVYNQDYFPIFKDDLATAGIDGTLKKRMLQSSSPVCGKTGALAGVSALSGYVEAAHDLFIFSIIINGYVAEDSRSSSYKIEIEDAIATELAQF